ncbi:MAG TPA: DUF222 domain-containing protein, partial [Mycobacteriales bacterium]|nr:DUF222 domain-containing protein [Mycobacteriales bacterium]
MTAAAGPTSPDPGPSFWTVERWTYWDFWARSFDQPWDSHAPGWRANAAMLGRLERLDVATLTDEQRIDWAVAVDKCLRAVQALRTRALAIAAGAQRSDPATEVGVLTLAGQLQQSPTQTAHQVTFARQMVTTFPDTLAAVDHGAIPMSYARAVYDETAGLSAEQCSAVEQAVLAKAAGRKPYQHTAALRRAVRKVAPRPAPEDDGSPEQERDARLRESGPWSSGLWMQGPAEQMALIAARLAAATAVPRTEQD